MPGPLETSKRKGPGRSRGLHQTLSLCLVLDAELSGGNAAASSRTTNGRERVEARNALSVVVADLPQELEANIVAQRVAEANVPPGLRRAAANEQAAIFDVPLNALVAKT